jgi:hypothetical protein
MATDHSPVPTQIPDVAYCTMFDAGYLGRGIALLHSLRSHGVDNDVWVLALDDETRRYLELIALANVRVVSVNQLEEATQGLSSIRDNRTQVERYFTCTPALVRHVLAQVVRDSWVVYLDADMWFYRSPNYVFDQVGDADVGIVEHRFPERLSSLRQYGTFNVAWVMVRSSPGGHECANWWTEQCLQWCFDRVEDGKYADQGYLDRFPELFRGTIILDDPGLNVAPWNLRRHQITSQNSELLVDGTPLTFFHFHGLRRRGDWFYPNLATYRTRMSKVVRDDIYVPYTSALLAAESGSLDANLGFPIPRSTAPPATRNRRSLRSAAHRARRRFAQIAERVNSTAIRITEDRADETPNRAYQNRIV